MSRWKDIKTAPKDRNFLVDGGMIEGEVSFPRRQMTEPVKVEPSRNSQFQCVDVCGYAVWVDNPTHWTDLPTRPMCYAIPPRLEYDL